MKDLVSQLSQLAGKSATTFGAVDLAPLFDGVRYELAPSVAEYFRSCVPGCNLDLRFYEIFGGEEIIPRNREYVPSLYCASHGVVSIADGGGDAFAVDVTDGRVYRISSDKVDEDGIRGWNSDYSGFLPTLPISRQNIIDTSERCWECIPDFLSELLRRVTEYRRGLDSSPKNAREFLAGLPSDCHGPERLLSRALYQLAYDSTQSECIGSVHQLARRYGRDITLEHLLILPEKAYRWILGGFAKILLSQANTPDDELALAFLHHEHISHLDLASKTWAASFLREAHQRRPLLSD